MNDPSINPPEDESGIAGVSTNGLRQPTYLRLIVALAATVVVLVRIHLSAPVFNPIIFAVVLTLLFSPLYSWLKGRGLSTPIALLIMLIFVGAIFVALLSRMPARWRCRRASQTSTSRIQRPQSRRS